MNSKKMIRSQMTELISKKYSGEQLFNMMVDFYKKFNPLIASALVDEEKRIYNITNIHYMYDMLEPSMLGQLLLKNSTQLKRETICGETNIYLKRKETNEVVQCFDRWCASNGCKWPDNIGITDNYDYLNKWFCHYNEI